MIRYVGAGEPSFGGQLAGVARPVKQGNQDPATGWVGQCPAQPGKGRLPRLIRQHMENSTADTDITDGARRLSTTLNNRPTIGVLRLKEARGANSICARPSMMPVVLVRRHDTRPVWTWIALCGLLAALLLAVLGLPPLDLHGPLHRLGVMDPFCGGTRSVYLTLHRHLRDAVLYNPAGPVLVGAALALLLRAAIGWSSRRWVDVRVPRRLLIPLAVVTLAALELNQQLHAALLMQP
jgi:hypothetical protein